MAVTLTPVGRNPSNRGDMEYHTYDVVFSGNYATGGEAITAASVGLVTGIQEVRLPPVTAGGFYPLRPVYNADGSVNILAYELSAGAAGTPALQEKTNAEAYVASTACRIVFIGLS